MEEWSGGKIKFNVLYSASRVSTRDMEKAMSEGLVDMGQHVSAFNPDTFKVADYASQAMYLHQTSPVVGSLQMAGAWIEFGATNKALREELQANDVQPLLPTVPTGSAVIMCNGQQATSLPEFAGKQVRPSTKGQAEQLAALGATSVDVPTQELYQSFQRKVIDCGALSLATSQVLGLAEVTTDWTVDHEVQLTGTPVGWSMSKSRYDELPLAARQLLWDRADVYIQAHIESTMFATYADAVSEAKAHHVKFHEFQPDARAALTQYFDKKTAELPSKAPAGVDGQAFIGDLKASHDKWRAEAEQLGYGQANTTWSDIDTYVKSGQLNVKPFVDKIVADDIVPNRPTK